MTWPQILVGVVTVLYVLTSIGYFVAGDWRHGLVFLGYTVANIGVMAIR